MVKRIVLSPKQQLVAARKLLTCKINEEKLAEKLESAAQITYRKEEQESKNRYRVVHDKLRQIRLERQDAQEEYDDIKSACHVLGITLRGPE